MKNNITFSKSLALVFITFLYIFLFSTSRQVQSLEIKDQTNKVKTTITKKVKKINHKIKQKNGRKKYKDNYDKYEKYKEKYKNTTLIVGATDDYPPFNFNDNGKIIGIDIDIINEISKRSGITFKKQIMAFNTLIAGLESHKIDVSVSGMTVTPERKQSVDFSVPYYKTKYAIISHKTNSYNLQQLEGKTVATQTGTTMFDFLTNYNNSLSKGRNKINIITNDNNALIIEMIKNHKVDAVVMEDLQGSVFCKINKQLVYTTAQDNNGDYAIALVKGSEYQEVINDILVDMRKDGTLDRIVNKWVEWNENREIMENKAKQYNNSLFLIVKSALYTLQYTIYSIFFGLIIALILSIMRYCSFKPLTILSRIYISVVRGTPILLQLSFVYFGFPKIFHLDISVFTAGIICFSMNSAAYVAEIIRSGIRAIDKGQFDACKSLNLSKYQAIKDVYIPQILNNIFPALVNEFSALIKESSIISVFGGYEIMKQMNLVVAEYYSYFTPLIVAGITYYFMTLSLELFAHWWERNYSFYSKKRK